VSATASTAFHDAARLLIDHAPVELVKRILRQLLEDEVTAGEAAPVRNPRATPASPERSRRVPGKSPGTAAPDPEWETLRKQIRTAMAEREVSYADLGEVLGLSELSAKLTVNRTRLPSKRVHERLREWLAEQPSVESAEVDTPPLPFRAGTAGQRVTGNGADATAAG
jgi:hypothetical protein